MSEYVDAAQPRYDHVAALLRRFAPPPARIIELGSAPGHQIAQLAGLGYEATSLDLGAAEDEWGSGGEGEFRRILATASVRHLEWDLERLPLPIDDASFDVAVMTEVLEHLREYPVRSLREVLRILRPRGILILTTPNQAYLAKRLRLLGGKNVQTPLHDWSAECRTPDTRANTRLASFANPSDTPASTSSIFTAGISTSRADNDLYRHAWQSAS